jgi:hypothetical protein
LQLTCDGLQAKAVTPRWFGLNVWIKFAGSLINSKGKLIVQVLQAGAHFATERGTPEVAGGGSTEIRETQARASQALQELTESVVGRSSRAAIHFFSHAFI